MRTVNVFRTSADTGTIILSGFDFSAREACWWNASWVIEARCYPGYPSYMRNKYDGMLDNGLPYGDGSKTYREAIHLGQGVKWSNGKSSNNGIFLHRGSAPSHSDGCIVTSADLVYNIWKETREFRGGTTSGAGNLIEYNSKMEIYVTDLL